MTIPEIKALKQELEAALLCAFTDFQTKTGLAVESIEVARSVVHRIDSPNARSYITSLNVKLESV